MKIITLSGLVLSILFLCFGLYLHFVVAPDAELAKSEDDVKMQAINEMDITEAERTELMQSPERRALFERMEMKTDYGIYCMMGSILPFLLCLVASIKKQKMGYVGILLSLAAFFIGAAYGSHMFS